ncbi:MAG: hypothetical protein IT281_07415, partial [Ignavibacteria bacterium]|nr:hypothetical protein [Ignavibacteria bacterium]
MKIFKTFLFMFFVVFLAGNSYSQQESKMDWGPIITGTEIPSNKIDSRLNKVVSQQEIDLNNQMKIAKKQGDMLKVQQLNYQMEKVSSDIKIVTPVLLPGSELTLALGDKAPFYNTELVSNFQVTSSLNVKASAIATEMRQASAGTLWLVVAQGTTRDTLRIYNSTTNGVTWTFVASYNSPAGVAPTINYDELDIEIIENTTGDKFLHGV